MTTTEILETVTTLAAAGALVAPVVYLLERTHRRTSRERGGRVAHWLRGADHDADARRLAAELRALPTPPTSSRGTETAPVPRLRGRRHVWVTPAR